MKNGEKNHNTSISQPGLGLDIWQCSLKILHCPEGKQPKLGIIFHSKVCVTMDEKLTYHRSRIIFFQTNAWINKDVCKRWIDTTLSTDEFKEKISAIRGLWIMLVWFEKGHWSMAANERWMCRCSQEIIQYPVKGVVREGWECRSLL